MHFLLFLDKKIILIVTELNKIPSIKSFKSAN